jgi:septation ring formation regulator EzrA
VYNKKSDAVESLKKDEVFLQGIDYQVLRQNPQNQLGGRPKDIYKLSIPCLEYFIARKVRPVFEVYRQVFHATADVAKQVRADNTKMEKLKKENEFLKHQIEVVKSIYKQETNLKCSCFSFLVKKKLYDEWELFRKEQVHQEFLRSLQ